MRWSASGDYEMICLAPSSVQELFEYTDPRGNPAAKSRTQADHGFSHVGLTSSDTRADFTKLKDKGVIWS